MNRLSLILLACLTAAPALAQDRVEQSRLELGGAALRTLRAGTAITDSTAIDAGLVGNGGDVGASYAFGADSAYRVRVGAGFGDSWFSLSPARLSPGAEEAPDVNLSLSLTHDVTPNLSLTGNAGAGRAFDDEGGHSQFHLGAGVGVKF